MYIHYDLKKMARLLYDFAVVTGLNISIRNTDFVPYDAMPVSFGAEYCTVLRNLNCLLKKCDACDQVLFEKCKRSGKWEIHTCHAGLVDIAVPILYHETVVAYVSFGQIKKDPDFASVADYLSGFPLNLEEMKRLYDKLPLYDEQKIESVANMAAILARHILLDNILTPRFDEDMEKTLAFIDLHLDQELSIPLITQITNVSKSTLYRNFHAHFGCTINEYITKRRLEYALSLLGTTKISIEEIARTVGFSGATQFGKLFKKEYGVTPLKYRKQLPFA